MNFTNDEVFTVITTLVCDLFGTDESSITPQTKREIVTGWDSLQHVNLVIDIERHFQIRLSGQDVASIETVGDLVQAVLIAQSRSGGV